MTNIEKLHKDINEYKQCAINDFYIRLMDKDPLLKKKIGINIYKKMHNEIYRRLKKDRTELKNLKKWSLKNDRQRNKKSSRKV